MKVVRPGEVFEVLHFQPEYDAGIPKYGAHETGAQVVSGHSGPEGIVRVGDQRKVIYPGDVVLRGNRGGHHTFKREEFEAKLAAGEFTVVPETGVAGTYDPASGAVRPAQVDLGQGNAQEAQSKTENVEGDEGIQSGEAAVGIEERPQSEIAGAGNSNRVETVGSVEGEEEKAAAQRKRRS